MCSLYGLPAVAIAIAFVIVSGGRADAADVAHGEHVFAKCAPCHAKNDTAGLGPGLLGGIGKHAGSTPGFRYSRAMKKSNIVWEEKSLEAFISGPKTDFSGLNMLFYGSPE